MLHIAKPLALRLVVKDSHPMMRLTIIFSAIALLPGLAPAKRSVPPKVEPVVRQGIRYLAPNDDGRRAYIEAWDVQTNKKLWDLTVFTNRIDPKLEEDVQWVFIEAMRVAKGGLVITSERGNTYQINLGTKAIAQSDEPSSQSSRTVDDLPDTIKRAIVNGSLAKEYEISFRMNPSFLRGDFDGNGKVDIAVFVKARSTGKFGVAIIYNATNKATVLGAGTTFGNGGDDFEWMDSWEIYSKDRVTRGTSAPKLHGDALLVSKSEAASALICWNGKRYVWLQQGD
jgi:hypothetical protein